MSPWLEAVLLILSPVFSAGGAWMAVKVKLDWHQEKITDAHRRLDEHDSQILEIYRTRGSI